MEGKIGQTGQLLRTLSYVKEKGKGIKDKVRGQLIPFPFPFYL
jgi:hypothetical protein